MDQLTNYNHKIDVLSNDAALSQPIQAIVKSKYKKRKCNECNKRRKSLNESHQMCHVCYNLITVFKQKQSGIKIIDDFIRHTQINYVNKGVKMEYPMINSRM